MVAKLNLLGHFEIITDSGSTLRLSSKNGQAILAMLAMARNHTVARDKLIGTFWAKRSDQQAKNSLRQSLSTLKKLFTHQGLNLLDINHSHVSLKTDQLEVDVHFIPDSVEGLSMTNLESLLALIRGQFLENINTRQAMTQHWLESHRHFFQNRKIDILRALLTGYIKQQNYQKANSAAESLLTIDPLNEQSHQSLMKIYSAQGDRVSALKQYQKCKNLLNDELSVKPCKNTTKLFNAILNSSEDSLITQPVAKQTVNDNTHSSKPSIVVLPFKNISANQQQESFCDGLTEDIITRLSQFRDLLVISSNSSFFYKNKALDNQTIASELKIQFILEGSVQQIAEQLRVSVQLIDATTSIHLWTKSYDRHSTELFNVQDEVSQLIVGTLASVYGGRLRKAWQKHKPICKTTNPVAFDLFMKGIDCANLFTKSDNKRGRGFFQQAVSVDPNYAKAYSGIACTHMLDAAEAWSNDYSASLNKSREFANRAIECDDSDSWSYWQLAVYYIYTQKHDLALLEFEKAIDLNPNDADVLADAGYYFSYCGKALEGLDYAQKAMKLNPHYPEYYILQMAQILFDARQYKQAVDLYKKVRCTDTTLSNLYLAASNAALGDYSNSTIAINKVLALDEHATVDKWTDFRLSPYKNKIDLVHFREKLQLSGLQ